LGAFGIWAELSSAISFAGALTALRDGLVADGPIVVLNTSSGFKDHRVACPPGTDVFAWHNLIQSRDTGALEGILEAEGIRKDGRAAPRRSEQSGIDRALAAW
jgi:threonine synthase